MTRDLDERDAAPAPAPGVTVRAATDRDAVTAHAIWAEAFADHWRHTHLALEPWWRQRLEGAGHDLSLWWLAAVDGVPSGLLVGSAQMADEEALFVPTLGVRRPARGRGVATALLRTAFAAARERGWSRAVLYVDADSPTGAGALYARVGMRADQAHHVWTRTLP